MHSDMKHSITVLILLVVIGLSAARAAGQGAPVDYLKQVNALVAPPAGTEDATTILFTALAAMDAPPDPSADHKALMLMTRDSRGWSRWEEWANKPNQRAVIEAVKRVTDPDKKYVLGLPYGEDAAEAAWVKAGLYVDLGKPPLLARAKTGLKYLDGIDRAITLMIIEGERQVKENDPDECVEVMLGWVRLARMLCDRPFAHEIFHSAVLLQTGVERLADLACANPGFMTEEAAKEAVDGLDPDVIARERIRFPQADKIAMMQIISLTMDERGGPREAEFPAVMARVTAVGGALDQFRQAAYWAQVMANHAGWFDTRDAMEKVYGDWEKRWGLNDIHDPYMLLPSDFSKLDLARFAIVTEVLKGCGVLFDARIETALAVTGVRSAMAVVGYRARHKVWPPQLPAVQPQHVGRLDMDPWFYNQRRKSRQIYRYFVPIRDQKFGEREQPHPHIIGIGQPPPSDAGDGPGAVQGMFGGDVGGLPGLGALPSEIGEAQRLFAEGLKNNPIPEGMFDDQALTLDVAKLREWSIKGIELGYEGEKAEKSISGITEILKALDAEGITEENIARKIKEAFPKPPATTTESSPDPIKALGIDRARLESVLIDGATAALKHQDVRAAREALKASGSLTAAQAKAAALGAFGAILQPTYIDPIMEMVRGLANGPMGPAFRQALDSAVKSIAESAAGGAGDNQSLTEEHFPPFIAQLTEADFTLYSVGPDMKDDFAEWVGVGGSDVLIWPPEITLRRRFLSGSSGN